MHRVNSEVMRVNEAAEETVRIEPKVEFLFFKYQKLRKQK